MEKIIAEFFRDGYPGTVSRSPTTSDHEKSLSLIPSILLVGAGAGAGVGVGVGLGLYLASDSGVLEKFPFLNSATAQESPEHKVSPIAPIPEREMYYPDTEKLGNGDKFPFDIGTGSAERIPAMQIAYNFLPTRLNP